MYKTMILVAGLLFLGTGISFAQETKTIKGEVIDVSCYVLAGEKGEAHKSCALDCIQAGEPAGILEEGTGNIYVVITADHTSPAKKILPYVAKMVEVTGTVNERGGVNVIDISEIKEINGAGMGMSKEGMGMQMRGEGMGMSKEKMGMGM